MTISRSAELNSFPLDYGILRIVLKYYVSLFHKRVGPQRDLENCAVCQLDYGIPSMERKEIESNII